MPFSYDSFSKGERSPLLNRSSLDDRGGRRDLQSISCRATTVVFILAIEAMLIVFLFNLKAELHNEDLSMSLGLWTTNLFSQEGRAQFYADQHRTELVAYDDSLYQKSGETELEEGCEATVMIVRHCEKAHVREHCDYVGYERAVYLSTLFGHHKKERWPAPSFIYAMSAAGRNHPSKRNFREIETVRPLANKFNLTIDSNYSEENRRFLAKKIFKQLRHGELCGKLTVVCWKHSEIPELALHFGCGPKQGCPQDYPAESFDQVWQIKYAYFQPKHSEKKSGALPHHDKWKVFGSVQHELFDPLSLSKDAGDYPKGGTAHGGRWRNHTLEVPERKNPH